MKKLINLKGAVTLNKAQQKEVNGGAKLCNGNCAGRPSGSRCYYQGHCGCPGECSGDNGPGGYAHCIPY